MELIICRKYLIQLFKAWTLSWKMPEKTQKRKLRSHQSTSQEEIESYNHPDDENVSLSEQDFEDFSSKIEKRLSKRLMDTEFGQKEILKLIENLTSKVDSRSNPASEQCSSALRFGFDTDPVEMKMPSGTLVPTDTSLERS